MSNPRISHGDMLPIAYNGADAPHVEADAAHVGAEAPPPSEPSYYSATRTFPFGYMFPELQCDEASLLPESPQTVTSLRDLGAAMKDPGPPDGNPVRDPEKIPGVPVPTAYTFFGQFVDHDITFEQASDSIRRLDQPSPIPHSRIKHEIVNSRSPNLELDSVYSPVAPWDPANRDKMLLGVVSRPDTLPPGKDAHNDLPRNPASTDPKLDRAALIGDPRNDENVIVAQLHVAFLRAHNALVDRGCNFNEARKLLIQHYQWIVLNDFLGRILDPAIAKKILRDGPKFFTPTRESFFMPLEFSVAAYRFGHSKVREVYPKFNQKQGNAHLGLLFAATRFSGNLIGYNNMPGNWVIDWTNFLNSDDPDAFPRPIDTALSPLLLDLKSIHAVPEEEEGNLAVRNLLRGYILRMPTGQAVANAMHAKSPSISPLTEDQIKSVVGLKQLDPKQLTVLEGPADLINKTPLWFYILAEAAYYSRGYHLGPVGSTIVAEVLIEVLRNSDYSVLSEPGWKPSLPGKVPGEFDLSDLFRLAGVL